MIITGGYGKFVGLGESEPNFTPILALGGWANSAAHYSAVRKTDYANERPFCELETFFPHPDCSQCNEAG